MTANDFFQGNIFDAYEYFGAHVCRDEKGREAGVWFRVFAPNASRVALFGECNSWGETEMNRCEVYGTFECFCPQARAGQMYKYRIWGPDGKVQDHADPYGYGMEVRPACCSIIRDLSEYRFGDQEWMTNRTVCTDRALNIYEMHAGSWRKPDAEEARRRFGKNAGKAVFEEEKAAGGRAFGAEKVSGGRVTGAETFSDGGVTGTETFSDGGVSGAETFSDGGVTGTETFSDGGVTGAETFSDGGVTGAGTVSGWRVSGEGKNGIGKGNFRVNGEDRKEEGVKEEIREGECRIVGKPEKQNSLAGSESGNVGSQSGENTDVQEDLGAAQWYSYRELAPLLIPYLKENHYTHVEFMPLAEHPFDGSWGYQQTGFFAPTSRYGTAQELQYLVDQLHQAGIGVIVDFVPVHFAMDGYGLKEFDGTCLYEYPNDAVGFSEWGSANFIHSRKEVWCFIQSAANYWLDKYHVDGLRYDAVSRLIYWQGSEQRGVNNTTLEFLKHLNQGLKERHPTAMLIAEDSTSYPGVTRSIWENGLGFDYKWDLGWMHDTLEYFQTPPEYRTRDYHKLTFSMMYYYNEKYLLEFSHDEVVHGKATILQKMYGDYNIKFPQGRGLYLYMMMHPGKKLNFMGSEIGQFREWDESREQDWFIRKYPLHDSFYHYIQELNRIYSEYVCLHKDYDGENFKWLDCHQEERCIYTILRQHYGSKSLVAVFNFSHVLQEDYSVFFPSRLSAKLILNSDWEQYGGSTVPGRERWEARQNPYGVEVKVSVPAFSGILFETE